MSHFWADIVHAFSPRRTEKVKAEVEEARAATRVVGKLRERALAQLSRSEDNAAAATRVIEQNHLIESIHETITIAVTGRKEREV